MHAAVPGGAGPRNTAQYPEPRDAGSSPAEGEEDALDGVMRTVRAWVAEEAGRTFALLLLAATVGDIAHAVLLHHKFSDVGNEMQDVEKIVQKVQREAPEIFFGSEQLAKAAGFGLEMHTVRTEDGYLLGLHRLVRRSPAGDASGIGSRAPVLMIHGLLCSSDIWLLGPRDHALAFLLTDKGYDVWLGNVRGNPYSRKHERLSNSDPAFWNFSWHEMGVYDVPASVDYVLAATGKSELQYVGHSMGNTVYYVMMSQRPEYNAKVRLHIALAPAVYLQHLRAPAARAVAPLGNSVLRAAEQQRTVEALAASAARDALLFLSCRDGAPSHALCRQGVESAYGPFHRSFNESMIPMYLPRVLRSSSLRTVAHFAQLIVSGRFRQWDEGSVEGNLRRYGRTFPPDYDLSRVTAPSAIFFSIEDFAVHPIDVQRLAKEQKHVVLLFRVPERPFNHLDHLAAAIAAEVIYKRVFELFDQFEHNTNANTDVQCVCH